VLSPAIAGFLFQGGLDLPTVALLMSVGSLAAAVLIMMLKLKPASEAEIEETMDKVAGRAS
jgi:hypothetical protein